MALRITLDLSSKDLKLLRKEMKKAQESAGDLSELEVIQAADEVLEKSRKLAVPEFVNERLETLQTLINMLTDRQWMLPDRERKRVRNALMYFAHPEDIIPDHIPGIGLLDDAIMIELIKRQLVHEIDAYQDFCHFRQQGGKVSRAPDQHLARRRTELVDRMRRRQRKSSGGGSPVGWF